MSEPLTPDKRELSRFVASIFKHANREGHVLLQAFPAGKGYDEALFAETIALDDPRFLDAVYERARETAGHPVPAAFCPPVWTFRPDSTEPFEGLCISIDADFMPNAGRDRLERTLGPATIVIASGGNCLGTGEPRLHLYWRLASPAVTPEDRALLADVREQAIRLAIADRGIFPLRWPGSWHRKGDPKLARIIFESETEIDLNVAMSRLQEGFDQLTDVEQLAIDLEDQINHFACLIADLAIPELLEMFEFAAREYGLSLLQYLRAMIRLWATGSGLPIGDCAAPASVAKPLIH